MKISNMENNVGLKVYLLFKFVELAFEINEPQIQDPFTIECLDFLLFTEVKCHMTIISYSFWNICEILWIG